MALLEHSGFGSQNITSGTQVFDFSDRLLANLRLEEAALAHIPIGDVIKDPVCYWVEDALVGDTVALTATLATAGTTITVSAADALKIGYNADSSLVRPGAIIQRYQTDAGVAVDNGEKLQVTAWGSSTTATVTRSYGATADPGSSYLSGTDFRLVGWPLPEGSNLGPDQSQARTPRYNLTQIFGRDITLTRNQIMRMMRSVDDEFMYQVDQRAIEVRRELNMSVIFGESSTSISGTFPVTPANSGDNRTMAGIIQFLTDAGGAAAGATYDSTAEAFTSKLLNGMHYASAILGGNPTTLLMGGLQSRAVNGFGADQIRIVPDSRYRQGWTTVYRTDTGKVLYFLTDFNMSFGAQGTVALIDETRLALRYVEDAAFFVLVAPTFTDGDSARVLGEWSLECRNAIGTLAAHAIHTALTVPS